MKVKELKELLADVDDELEVIMSKDAEGNHFSPWEGWSLGEYTAESTWSGEYTTSDNYDEAGWDGEIHEHNTNALCLWPVN